MTAAPAPATPPVPREPKSENSEYILDLVTNRYRPAWRDVWERGDNRFRLRLGSNDVARWFLEEELKASASLTDDRLRFRYWHTRKLRHETEEIRGDTFELEARLFERNYLSVYVTPSAAKADNAVGLILQSRRTVDRYTKFFIEFPHIVHNFVERNKDDGDSLITTFEGVPLRIGLVERDEVALGLTFWLEGEIVPEFTVVEEEQHTGRETRAENAFARSLLVRFERARAGRLRRAGLEGGYRADKRSGHTIGFPRAAPSGAAAVSALEFDATLYEIGEDDSISGWRNERWWIRPYALVQLTERVSLRGAFHVEQRELEYQHRRSRRWSVDNRYVVPTIEAAYTIDSRGRNTIEIGWASSYRERESDESGERIREDIQDDRLYLAWECAFGDAARLRLIESFELDAEDRGDYGIHDHGFVQVIVGF